MARTLAPIIAVSLLGMGTAAVGLLNSLGLAMFLLLSIPLGHLGDRISRPARMMATSTILRIVMLLLGLLTWLLGSLEGSSGIWILLGIMLVVGVADVVFTTGRGILIPRLVPVEQIRPLMGSVQTVAQIGTILAPAVLAALLAISAPPVAWAAAVLAYVISVVSQQRYRADEERLEEAPSGPTPGRLRDGIDHLLAEPTLRRITASSAFHNAAVMAANTLLPVIALTTLGLSPAVFAGIGVAGAVAGVAGAASGPRLASRLGLRLVRIAAALAAAAGVLPILLLNLVPEALPWSPAFWIGAFSALSGFCTAVSAVAGSDLIARLSPREKLGAVGGAQRTATMGVMPISALAIGLLGGIAGTMVASAVWLILTVAAAVPCLGLKDPDVPDPAQASAS